MTTIVHTTDRKALLEKTLPSTGDQLDALWNLLLNNPALKAAVQADPTFLKIAAVKAKYPKV